MVEIVNTVSRPRIASIDAYRGFVMFLMMAEVLRFSKLADAFPESPVWQFLALHQSHVPWRGCTLHDMIQPSFSFLVGVALPFSLAGRLARGQSLGRMIGHAAWRSLVLICLGIFLRSIGKPQTNFTFEDTLTQIGLGYLPLFLIGMTRVRTQWIVLIALLIGYWSAFALYPLPGPDFDYAAVGVPAAWPHQLDGFAAHWNKNSNLAWAADTWFLNLFPRPKPFLFNDGGYATLSFVPTLATMVLGLIAGGWLQTGRALPKFIVAGAVCLAIGWAADEYRICPSVKRIWTPAWVLYSGGWCFLLLAGFHLVLDIIGFQSWAYPLRVIGANSIVAYMMDHLIGDFIRATLRTHFGAEIFSRWGPYAPLVSGAAVLLVMWLILWWMYRQRIYVRV